MILESGRGSSVTSPIGRGIGRLWRPFLEKDAERSFGYVALAIRVRGSGLTTDRNPSPEPSPKGRGSPPAFRR
jgi:hypothetical protein